MVRTAHSRESFRFLQLVDSRRFLMFAAELDVRHNPRETNYDEVQGTVV
jgi:hypothetical protein